VADLEIDQTRMVQAGQNGLLARRVRVPLQDGVVGEGALADEWVQNPPVSRILGYGMSIPIRIIDTPYGPVEYWRAVPMSATSYSPSRAGTPLNAPWFGFTRSGKVLKQGMVATDTRLIPLGTRLYVPGYGLATVEDTGSGVRGRMIDLGYEDHNFRSWRAYLTVYLRTPVPPSDQITWILP
jgi:3D (Asp-Asp-Asp) domain-containing protein